MQEQMGWGGRASPPACASADVPLSFCFAGPGRAAGQGGPRWAAGMCSVRALGHPHWDTHTGTPTMGTPTMGTPTPGTPIPGTPTLGDTHTGTPTRPQSPAGHNTSVVSAHPQLIIAVTNCCNCVFPGQDGGHWGDWSTRLPGKCPSLLLPSITSTP